MLYTERAHFYHRYKIVNMLQGSENMTTTVLLSCFDMLRVAYRELILWVLLEPEWAGFGYDWWQFS
uniref:Uncharacterized protein n=1 Tax=Daucus carota subsp. sativus TaxID=79200 RepID=A0A166FWG0_DAUCS